MRRTDPAGQPASDFADTVAAMEESAQRRPSMERVSMLWIYRLIFTPFPLAEVMTLAWHSHYATSQTKVNAPELMLAQQSDQRTLWRAPISKLHRRMLGDGAMRRWLDGLNSTKAQPNENLGREFLELFALGNGQYTERDVREAARRLQAGVRSILSSIATSLTRANSTTVPRRSWARLVTGVRTIWSISLAAAQRPRPILPGCSTTHSFPIPIYRQPI